MRSPAAAFLERNGGYHSGVVGSAFFACRLRAALAIDQADSFSSSYPVHIYR